MRLTFEDGLIVLRKHDKENTLIWSCHTSEIKDYEGGFKELVIEGKLIQTNTLTGKVKIIE